MVQVMLTGFGGDNRKRGATGPNQYGITCYHVNARVSKHLQDIGDFRFGKFLLMLGYCAQAIWCRFRYGVKAIYYIPAPGKKSALYRDWLVFALCRPFFKHVILHWHAAGLAKWLETSVQIRHRATTFRYLKNVDLSIVLSNYNRADAEKLFPQRIKIVSNGIPDPCPDFDITLLPRRRARVEAREKILAGVIPGKSEAEAVGGDPHIFRVLYLAHCTAAKGLFDALDGVMLANKKLTAQGSPISIRLAIAGNFVDKSEQAAFEKLLEDPAVSRFVNYVGFAAGDRKTQALCDADALCFPTFYTNENQPVNLIEAMAFGLPIVTTRWRSLPEMFPPGYPTLVEIHQPQQIADILVRLAAGEILENGFEPTRQHFRKNFTVECHLETLASAIRSIESEASLPARFAEVRGT